MQIGGRLYYDKLTGNPILHIWGRSGIVIETTLEHDFETYTELNERVPGTVGMIQLEYNDYEQDFMESNGWRINLETMQPEFSYPDPADPEAPPVYGKPLTEQIAELEAQNMELMLAVAELAATNDADKMETQLAIAELANIVMGGE